ncbi:MAG: hypothetical protein EOP88_02755 [Verrucomicrobiaceae bacterium]|nr:MAG: hypothetical protein EOP88_02755 [Verrucomicrobiaceae bacterium]
MKDIRAEESRVYGMLGVAGLVLVAAIWAVGHTIGDLKLSDLFPLSIGVYFSAATAWRGLRAAHLCTDGKDLLVMRRKGKLMRLPVSGVMSVTCGASVHNLRVLTVEHDTGETITTLVKEDEITPFMALMPDRAITIYWREMITEVGAGRRGKTSF